MTRKGNNSTVHRDELKEPVAVALTREEESFADVVKLIAASRAQAMRAVNTTLIELYWEIGSRISHKLQRAEWGDGVVDRLAVFIARTEPGLRGFTRRNLFRMRQFYEAYANDPIVSPLVTQLPWSHHLIILGQSKRSEEREFYIRTAVRERWSRGSWSGSSRLHCSSALRLDHQKVSPAVAQVYPEALNIFRDAYAVEFLALPRTHQEADLHQGLLGKLKEFLIELGRGFCFVGSEFPLQVGGRDFALDLLFFHRGLNCLVAIELKVGRFEPEFLGKLSFYLEALNRDVRKAHEQPSIGLLLCASKDDEVVEYALSQTLSPTLIAEYQTQLPDKRALEAKLHEFYLQTSTEPGGLGDSNETD